jgi:hypothetical protein
MKRIFPVITALLLSTAAQAQSWNYKAYFQQGQGPGGGHQYEEGYVTLEDKNGESILYWYLPRMDKCFRDSMKVDVSRDEKNTTITQEPRMAGCYKVRLVIRNDGTGGLRFVEEKGQWRRDSKDRGLTLKVN